MVLKYQKLRFYLEAIEPIALPPYKGSALRGGFGVAFKKIACVIKKNTCSECLLKDQCAYAYVFETSPPEGASILKMEKYESIPHPFILEPPKENKRFYEPKEKFYFDLILIGKGINYLPYFILVFSELGQMGLGRGKGKFKLLEIWNKNMIIYTNEFKTLKKIESESIEIPEYINLDEDNSEEEEVTIEFKTPVRLKYNRDLVVRLEFFILITNLLRRLNLLNYFHGDARQPGWDHKQLIELAREVKIKNNGLRWYDWERYSGRQKTRLKLGGLKGRITYVGKTGRFMPWLKAGEIFHVGKATAFGLGEYVVLPHNEKIKDRES